MKKFIFISLFLICSAAACVAENDSTKRVNIKTLRIETNEPIVTICCNNGTITIKSDTDDGFYIWDMNGRLVEFVEVQANEIVYLYNYPQGIYWFRDKYRQVSKVVVK